MRRGRGAALWPGVTLAVFLALLAFILSFDALRIVAVACGVDGRLSWMFPLIVDGSTLVFTWAAWAFRTRRMATWYPWLMLVVFSLVSLLGNALHAHAVAVNGMLLPDWVPPLVATMPPVALLAATHMIVLAAGRTWDMTDDTAPDSGSEPPRETGPEPESNASDPVPPQDPAPEPESDASDPVPPQDSTPEPEDDGMLAEWGASRIVHDGPERDAPIQSLLFGDEEDAPVMMPATTAGSANMGASRRGRDADSRLAARWSERLKTG